MLIDRHLPDADATRTRHVIVHAHPEETFEALGTARLHDPILRTLFHVSRLPARIRWRLRGWQPSPDPEQPTLKEVSWRERMPLLDERAGDELVSGVILRTRATPGKRVRDIAASEFASYREPEHVKLAMSMSVRPYGTDKTLLVEDVRMKGTDPATSRWIERGSRVTRSIQDILMDLTLDEVREEAERPQPPPGRPGSRT